MCVSLKNQKGVREVHKYFSFAHVGAIHRSSTLDLGWHGEMQLQCIHVLYVRSIAIRGEIRKLNTYLLAFNWPYLIFALKDGRVRAYGYIYLEDLCALF